MDKAMDIESFLRQAKKRVGTNGDLLGVEVLLAFVLGKNREYLIAHSDLVLSEEQAQRFLLLFDRFLAGEPVAYLTNVKEFFGLDFYVDSRVLIPRPETELLVEKVLTYVQDRSSLRVLEVGTGSGCIAVSLAKKNPKLLLTAVDISTDALAVARFNAERHHVCNRIRFLESDLLKNVSGSFDVIVANLPYIGLERFHFVSEETYRYEPHVALFAGSDGLSLYERLFQQLKQQSWQPSLLLGEFGFMQREAIEALYHQYFQKDANSLEIVSDYARIERIFIISPAGLANAISFYD